VAAYNKGTRRVWCATCKRHRYALFYDLSARMVGLILYGCHHEWKMRRPKAPASVR
jgi:hypothetical protein